jgi:hypothetical protein
MDLSPKGSAPVIMVAGRPAVGSPTATWWLDSRDVEGTIRLRDDVWRLLLTAHPDVEPMASRLIIDELLTNTCIHAPGPVQVELSGENGTPTVTITDSGPGFELDGPPAGPTGRGGRGLAIVGALATELSLTPAPAGGTVARAGLPRAR